MTPLFLFGTLRHQQLLQAVIGETGHLTLQGALLNGYEVSAVVECPLPTIVAKKTGATNGVLISGLSQPDIDRLDYYASAFSRRPEDIELADGKHARAYFPYGCQRPTAGLWDYSTWEREWAALSVLAAEEVMGYRDTKTPKEISAMLPMIRARAWSRLNAEHSKHGTLTLPGRVEVQSRRRPYANYFALDEYDLKHERFDGSLTPEVTRAVFRAPDATLVLPYDPFRDSVLVVEQMRTGPLARGDRKLWQLEPIAGRLDAGETPEQAARREAMEEAGLEMGDLIPVAETYSSPGNSSEFYYIFLGLADLPAQAAGVGGLEEETEDIRSHILGFDQLMELSDSQQLANTPLVLVSYWLARHRDRLRAAAGVR